MVTLCIQNVLNRRFPYVMHGASAKKGKFMYSFAAVNQSAVISMMKGSVSSVEETLAKNRGR
jgi:hypothetical protein